MDRKYPSDRSDSLLGFGALVRKTKASRYRPKKAPSQARAVATVDAILGATARILVTRGYAALTTNHVAKKAGVSIGSLYEWFPGKEALVAGLVDRHLARAESLLAERAAELEGDALARPPLELARALATTMVELHEDDPRLHRVLTEEVPHPAETRARIRAVEERMNEVLAALFAAHPDVHVPDAEVAARMVTGLLEAATHRWATDRAGEPIPRDTLITELAEMVAAYVTAERS